jgi:pyruvate dehydrogenase E2 component (dihydrolipoamide acetyltransferase)
MFEFKLPSLGADMDKGTMLEWKVAPGQPLKKGDVVAVVDTTKAAVDVEIWSEGTVHALLVDVGQEVPVGTPILALLAPGEAAPALGVSSGKAGQARPRVSPAARKQAAEMGLDLTGIAGTGVQGSVTLEDVARAGAVGARPVTARAPAIATGLVAPSIETRAAGDRQGQMRSAIAAAMGRSKREIPHYYLSETIPMGKALNWLRGANAQRPPTERLLPAALMLKAVALATHDFPEMNGLFVDGVYHPSAVAHVGVAISLRQGGLIAPALHDVGHRELETVMLELADLVRRCRAGSLRSSEMSDPTITVTNLGDQGVEQVFGVIYPPQVALVGFGRVVERPWVVDGQLTTMPVVTASLSADHRVSDGHRGALFLAKVGALLQQPQML